MGQVEGAVEQLTKTGLPLVALVNNAALYYESVVEHMDLDHLKLVFETNLLGTVRVTQATIPLLLNSRGRVINIGSIAGVIPAGEL